jgi:receptor expression-enhancing protein 5/6
MNANFHFFLKLMNLTIFKKGKKHDTMNMTPKSATDILNNLRENQKNEESVNDKLMKIKELKYLYMKTGIQPIYFLYILIFCLVFLVIGYFESFLTCLIGVLYPMYFSIKAMREKNKENIKNWLQYWILYSIFLNFECIFSYFLNTIHLYFFYKVVFLLICFLPQYNGAKYFYDTFIRRTFRKYENDVCELTAHIARRIRTTLLDEESENYSEDS